MHPQPSLPAPYYQDSLVTLYHGDAAALLPLLPRADLLLTDPPYGIGIARRGRIGNGRRFAPKAWDNAPPAPWLIQLAISRAKHAIIWGGTYLGLGRATCSLVWDKRNDGLSFSQAELAWTNLPSLAVRLFRYRWSGAVQEPGHPREIRLHPTQKPVPLLDWCLGKARHPASVIDPFAGSASTLVAARARGIPAIGIELDEDYCRLAAERLRTRDPMLN